jgi:hypothetical protein
MSSTFPPFPIYSTGLTVIPIEDNCNLVFTVVIGQAGDKYTLKAAISPDGELVPSDLYVDYEETSQDVVCNAGAFAIDVQTIGPKPIIVEYKITKSFV